MHAQMHSMATDAGTGMHLSMHITSVKGYRLTRLTTSGKVNLFTVAGKRSGGILLD